MLSKRKVLTRTKEFLRKFLIIHYKEKKMLKKMTILIGALLCTSLMANVRDSVRVTKLNPDFLSRVQKGEIENITIEFKEGDRLPVNLRAEGDLFESVDSNPTFIEVKKNFFVRIMSNDLSMSFDGENFKPLKESIGGSLVANASSSNNDARNFPANIINIVFSAFVK